MRPPHLAQLPPPGRHGPHQILLFLDSARDDAEAPRPNQTGSCRSNGLRPCFHLDAEMTPYNCLICNRK